MVKKAAQRILLCGFMGCGKSSVGQALAFRLKWNFLDTDTMIEKRSGMTIPQIFEQFGEEEFRRMERELAAQLGKRKNTVISTGGGFLMQEETVKNFRESSGGFESIVMLDCSFETCYRRIKSSDRPLVRNHTKEELREIFDRRRERYLSVSDLVVSNEEIISTAVEQMLLEIPVM